jgi:hypothetical protein
MVKKQLFGLWLSAIFLTAQAQACGNHLFFYLDPEKAGFLGGALIKMAGLAPPEALFKLNHPPALVVPVGAESSITVDYKRPWRSENVRIKLASSKNVDLQEDEFELPDLKGKITVPFRLKSKGIYLMTITVIGQHKGETHRYSSRMYVRAEQGNPPKADQA